MTNMSAPRDEFAIVADLREIILHRFRTASMAEILELASGPRIATVETTARATAPRIGEYWHGQGGIYAGIERAIDDSGDAHLIVGPEYDGTGTWDDMQAWAAKLTIDGHSDFALPRRRQQALCFANVPELFQAAAYWSCEQHESSPGGAWSQTFNYGNQNYWRKDHELRARAVRRLIIQ